MPLPTDGFSIVYSEGEEDRILRAAKAIWIMKWATPVLMGRRATILRKMQSLGLGGAFAGAVIIFDPSADSVLSASLYRRYQQLVVGRRAAILSRDRFEDNRTLAAAVLAQCGYVDMALCGGVNDFRREVQTVRSVISLFQGVRLHALIRIECGESTYFFCDPFLTPNPDTADLVEMISLASDFVAALGTPPHVTLVSRKSRRRSAAPSLARKIQGALSVLEGRVPDLICSVKPIVDITLRDANATLVRRGGADLYVATNLIASAHIRELVKSALPAQRHGPILMGMSKPVHVLLPSADVLEIVNASLFALSIGKGVVPMRRIADAIA